MPLLSNRDSEMARPRESTDEQLIAAAAHVISARGRGGMTFAAVAAEAGVAVGTLAHRFGSKRRLLLAVARSGAASVPAAFAAAAAAHPRDPTRAVAEALAGMVATVADPGEVAHHVGFLELDLRDPEFGALAVAHARAVRQAIADLLGDEVLARRVKALYDGTLIGWALEPDGPLADAVRRDVLALLA